MCYNTAWQPPGLFFLLEEAPLRTRDKPTQPCRLAHTAPRCSLSSSAVPGLHALLTPGCPVLSHLRAESLPYPSRKSGFYKTSSMRLLPCLSQGHGLFPGESTPLFYVDTHHEPWNITQVWMSLSASSEPLRAGMVPSHLHAPSSTQGTLLVLCGQSRRRSSWH